MGRLTLPTMISRLASDIQTPLESPPALDGVGLCAQWAGVRGQNPSWLLLDRPFRGSSAAVLGRHAGRLWRGRCGDNVCVREPAGPSSVLRPLSGLRATAAQAAPLLQSPELTDTVKWSVLHVWSDGVWGNSLRDSRSEVRGDEAMTQTSLPRNQAPPPAALSGLPTLPRRSPLATLMRRLPCGFSVAPHSVTRPCFGLLVGVQRCVHLTVRREVFFLFAFFPNCFLSFPKL